MNVLIFEDEKHTAIRLSNLLKEYDNSIDIIDVIGSVKMAIKWFEENEMPDLIFQDIVLSDGNCFDIFNSIDITSPIIFTTAFSEYALRSFQVNSIDYLLKPYDSNDLKKSLDKFKKFKGLFQLPEAKILEEILIEKEIVAKKRLLIKSGENYFSIQSNDIAYFISEDGVTFAVLFNKKRHIIDYSIANLSEQMDSSLFFKINRKVLINVESIEKISTWFNSRLKIKLNPEIDEEIIVSRESVKSFKEWLGK